MEEVAGLEVNQITEAPLAAGPTHRSWFGDGGGGSGCLRLNIRVDMHIQGFLGGLPQTP